MEKDCFRDTISCLEQTTNYFDNVLNDLNATIKTKIQQAQTLVAFEKIEKEMNKIVKDDLKPKRFELPRDEAIKYMEEKEHQTCLLTYEQYKNFRRLPIVQECIIISFFIYKLLCNWRLILFLLS